MARMVKCCATGVHGKSDEFYKIGYERGLELLKISGEEK